VAGLLRDEEELLSLGLALLARPVVPAFPVRLLGLTVSSLAAPGGAPGQQLELPFAEGASGGQ
jgi:hypothetical protein